MKYEKLTSTITRFRLLCDGCGVDGLPGTSREEARELAEEMGWQVSDRTERAYCQTCAKVRGE